MRGKGALVSFLHFLFDLGISSFYLCGFSHLLLNVVKPYLFILFTGFEMTVVVVVSYQIEGLCGTYRGSTDANCQATPTQHKLNTVPHSNQSPEIFSE
jgi:hypothetical protein